MAKIVAGAALIAGAVALDVVTGGAAVGLTAAEIGALGSMGVSMLAGGIADALKYGQGTGVAVHNQSASAWIMVYGRQRIGGSSVDVSISGDGNRWLWMVIAHAAHRVKSMDAIYLNGQQAFCSANLTPANGGTVGTNGLQGNLIGTDDTNNQNMQLNGMVQPIHPTDANYLEYDNFYFDGNPRFWMAQYDGTQVEADPFYMANCRSSSVNGTMTPHWNSSCILQGTAYGIYRFWWNANWSGPPALHIDVHGKNDIYDPRLDTSPGANPTDAAYQIYTENAALVLADFLVNTQWGLGYKWTEINMAQLVAAANVCDELVTLANPQTINGVTITEEPRYAINGVMDSSMEAGACVQSMLSAMGGSISFIGGEWYIWPAQYQGASGIVLNPVDLIGPLTFNPKKKARDLYNEVRASFVSPAAFTTTLGPGIDVYQNTSLFNNFNSQWKVTDMVPFSENPSRDYGIDQWLTQDGGVKYIHNTKFPLTISHATCQRLAKIMLRRNRWQGSGTLVLPLQQYSIMPMDVLEVNYPPFSWVGKTIQVMATRLSFRADANGVKAPVFEVDFVETDPSIYEWLTTDELALTPNGMSQAGPTIALVAPCTSLVLQSGATTMAVGMTLPTILCTWVSPTTTYNNGVATATTDEQVTSNGHIYVEMSADNVNWQPVATLAGAATSYTIPSLSDGSVWYVRIRASRGSGGMSEYTQAGPITVSDSTLDIAANDVFYASSGVSVAFMQPFQGGQGLVRPQVLVPSGGPFVVAAASDWTLGSGWAVEAYPSGFVGNEVGAACAYLTNATATTQIATSAANFPLTAVASSLYTVQASLVPQTGAAGTAQCFIAWLNSSGAVMATSYGSSVAAGAAGTSLLQGVAPPAGAVAMQVGVQVNPSGGATGAWACTLLYGTGAAATLDGVPDGNQFARPLASALTSGQIDLSKAGVINRTANYIEYTAGGTVDSLRPAQVGADVTADNTALNTNNVGSETAATVAQGATGVNANLVPDSSLLFGWTYWSNPGAAWSIVPLAQTGTNGFQATSAASGTYQRSISASFYLTAGAPYVLSGYIDATNVTGGTPVLLVYNTALTASYAGINFPAGQSGRFSTAFTMGVPSGYTAGQSVPVVLVFTLNAATLTGNIHGAAPMIQQGGVMTAYQPNILDNVTGSLLLGALPSSVTPIAGLMPVDVLSDQTVNHFQTVQGTFPSATVTTAYGNTTTNIGTIAINASGPEDIFTVWLQCGTANAGSYTSEQSLSVNVDGGSAFGLGLTADLGGHASATMSYLGSISGLSAGAHTINILLVVGMSGSANATLAAGAGIALVQQIMGSAGGFVAAPVTISSSGSRTTGTLIALPQVR